MRNPKKPTRFRSIFAATVIGWLEFYDFALFGYFVNEIGEDFLPPSNPKLQSVMAWSLWGVAFLARPFGAIAFGWLGDTVSRVDAMRLSVLMMAVPTLIVGILPTFSQIGYLATFILLVSRVVQGIAVSGAGPGSLVYICEVCPQRWRTMMASCIEIPGGTGLASLAASIVRRYGLSWRLPFLAGLFIIYFGHHMKQYIAKSDSHAEVLDDDKSRSVFSGLKASMNHLIYTITVLSTGFFKWYILWVWYPWYLENRDYRPLSDALSGNTWTMIFGSLALLFAGKVSDYIGHEVSMNYALTFSIVLTPVFFHRMQTCEGFECNFIQMFYSVLLAFFSAPSIVWQFDLLPDPASRYTAIAFTRNLCSALLSGTSSSIASYLLTYYTLAHVAAVVMFFDFFSLICFWIGPDFLDKRAAENFIDTDSEDEPFFDQNDCKTVSNT